MLRLMLSIATRTEVVCLFSGGVLNTIIVMSASLVYFWARYEFKKPQKCFPFHLSYLGSRPTARSRLIG